MNKMNPFVIAGYVGGNYFCDRQKETEQLISFVNNGNNIVLMSPRRMGKTGLILHTFEQEEVHANYETFLIDIYSTKDLTEMVQEMGKSIVTTLAKRSEKALQGFLKIVSSLRAVMSFDALGVPTWGIERGSLQTPQYTLDQIFDYIESADKPCVIAIDEFQQIAYYPEKNVEAILRTKIQHCRNAQFIFSGSERSLLSEMFHSPSRPFYASTSTLSLGAISKDNYSAFVNNHFNKAGKQITLDTIDKVYTIFEGVTWYIQKIMNVLFEMTSEGETCSADMVLAAIQRVLDENSIPYADLLYQLSLRQKELLIAIAHEGKAKEIKGQTFIKKYNLPAPSSIHSTIKSLMDKQLITSTLGVYEVYDKFLAMWIRQTK